MPDWLKMLLSLYGQDPVAVLNSGLVWPTQELLDEKMAGGLGDTLRAVFGEVQGVAHQPFVMSGDGVYQSAYYTSLDRDSPTDSIYVANVQQLPINIDKTLVHEHGHSAVKKGFLGYKDRFSYGNSESIPVAFEVGLLALRNLERFGTSRKKEAAAAAKLHNESAPKGYKTSASSVEEAMKMYEERLNPEEHTGVRATLFGSDFRGPRKP